MPAEGSWDTVFFTEYWTVSADPHPIPFHSLLSPLPPRSPPPPLPSSHYRISTCLPSSNVTLDTPSFLVSSFFQLSFFLLLSVLLHQLTSMTWKCTMIPSRRVLLLQREYTRKQSRSAEIWLGSLVQHQRGSNCTFFLLILSFLSSFRFNIFFSTLTTLAHRFPADREPWPPYTVCTSSPSFDTTTNFI